MRYQQNIVWLFERHKPNPITNTSILIKVMSVTSGKHSEHDTEMACFVICTLLEQLRHPSCTVLHAVPEQAAQTQCASGFNCGYSLEDFRSMWSPHRWSLWVGCPPLGHTETAQCSIGPVH